MPIEHKYVRHSALGFILWPTSDQLWHLHVGRSLYRVEGTIVSAGFCHVIDGRAVCWGLSESLGVCSQPSDSEALTLQLGLNPR